MAVRLARHTAVVYAVWCPVVSVWCWVRRCVVRDVCRRHLVSPWAPHAIGSQWKPQIGGRLRMIHCKVPPYVNGPIAYVANGDGRGF